MKTYQEYFDEWQISVESRDLAFEEWLMLQLDRKEKQMIDKAREWICKDCDHCVADVNRKERCPRLNSLRKAMKEE